MAKTKLWGKSEYWGLTSDYDFDWCLTEKQKKLQEDLIELCRKKIRPHAIHCDKTYEYPRKSMDALAELGILGLIIPKEFGGLEENHVCCSMVCETIARYGCPSTAMVYTMHLGAVATLLFRYHNNKRIKELLPRINPEKLIGTLSYSDPATGGHIWFPLSSKAKYLDNDRVKLLKYGSWATSAGYADWYTIQTVSPAFDGNYSNLSCFLVYKDEIRASTDDWSALGMHGNQSGPLIIEGTFSTDRMIGPPGDGAKSNDEIVDAYFLFSSASVWNGISLACIDLAKKHVTRRTHADVGKRVCDYPTIQDYFGDVLTNTNASRGFVLSITQHLDNVTHNNNWAKCVDLEYIPRMKYLHWSWQLKLFAARNVTEVTDVMLHACGGSGYKTDLGLERLIRDGKAGWVMGPSNEILRNIVGMTSLLGLDAVDYWEQHPNKRALHHEIQKMTLEDKKKLADELLNEIKSEEIKDLNHPYQDTDFENPFNCQAPKVVETYKTEDGIVHNAGLNPTIWTPLALKERMAVTEKMGSFTFELPHKTDHTGCLPGQYVQICVNINGKEQTRYFSPVSRPDDFGKIEVVLRYESQGMVSRFFKELQIGKKVDFLGPCGGFEYEPNQLDLLTIFASGGGITPGLQLIRSIMKNSNDKTKINLLYFSESFQEILYKKELDQFKDSKLNIVYTLGEPHEDWDGEEGFIDTSMIDRFVTKPNGYKHKIMMCGGPSMTLSCLHSLKSLEYPSEMIFIYGQFGVEQVRKVYGRNTKLSSHTSN